MINHESFQVNALTIPKMIHIFQMDRQSELVQQTIIQTMKELKIKQNRMICRLKKNAILAAADWALVEKAITIESPFAERSEEILSQRYMDRIQCDQCQYFVTIPMSKYDFKRNFEDCRIQILRFVETLD